MRSESLHVATPIAGHGDAGAVAAGAAPVAMTADSAAAGSHQLGRGYAVLVALPLAFVVIGVAAFWHFVQFAFVSNPALNSLIAVVMMIGSFTMFGHVRRVYREDQVFHAGMAWLKLGAWSNEPDPKLGPQAHVLGMLGRLQKLGLGHQVYIQSAAMEPELNSLEQFFERKQELSQFIVGLMVGLGLLGTFVGLLETLIATSALISTIANSVGGAGGGGNMESEFARIVGGLQKPLSAMGTAFSASMFGLIGSIMLGFQMIVVRKTASDFVDRVREAVLSLAERSNVDEHVEITERFLSNLLADILLQHKETLGRLDGVSGHLSALVPLVREAALSSTALAMRVQSQEDALERTAKAVGNTALVVPLMEDVARTASEVFAVSREANRRVDEIAAALPAHGRSLAHIGAALDRMIALSDVIGTVQRSTEELLVESRAHAAVVRRVDASLLTGEKAALRQVLVSDD